MRTLILLCLSLLFFSCKDDPKTLFRLVDKGSSGLDFKNELFETEDTNIINLEYFYNGGGVVIGDFNNDGLNDIFFTGNMVENKLYLNKGDLSFEDVSDFAGIGGNKRWKSGAAVVDINNDGLLDIYVCATIALDSSFRRNMLFVNQGINRDGVPSFADKAAEFGIDDSGFSANAGFLDYDLDGDLDLFIINNSRQRGPVNYRPKVNDGSSINTDKLFRNNGDGTFTDVSKEAGILFEGYGLGFAFLDVNNDGRTDIYVCNDYITNDLLYVNQGDGKFANEIDKYIRHQAKFAMGSDAADINNDGHLDIITVDMMPDNNLRKKTVISGSGYITYINDQKFGYTHQYVRNMLQLNNGNGTFGEIGQLAGVYQTEWSWSPLFADFDNDGYKDLIITNGFPKDITDRDFISFREQTLGIASVKQLLTEVPSVKVPNAVFRNKGDLTFEDVTKVWGMDQPSFANGAAYADLDNDGDLDYVVNNVNDFVSLYENNLYTKKKKADTTNWIRLKLKGAAGNASAFGSKVTLRYNGKLQFAEHTVYRGYISCVEDALHFGLGKDNVVDTLMVQWPDNRVTLLTNVKANQVLAVDQSKSQMPRTDSVDESTAPLTEITNLSGLTWKHQEDAKIDFNIQRTLPKKFSQRGPGIAVGDVNGDGLEDVLLGSSVGSVKTIFLQNKNGTFAKTKGLNEDPTFEDSAILIFDADNDGDLDIYSVAGTYEYQTGARELEDRLYLNDGKGNFRPATDALPAIRNSGSCVRAADFDRDGDLDLFVGGNIAYGQYPKADSSFILINEKGRFTNQTSAICPQLQSIGIVNDAMWTDFDHDDLIDLVVVGEYIPVTFYRNTGERLERVNVAGLDELKGWYNSISAGDYDYDGDIDFVVGNLGYNNNYSISEKHPLQVCAKDFDNNGSLDPVISCYVRSEDGEMKMYPVHFWDELNSQSPKFRRKFATYKEFAVTTTDKFFSAEDLKDALILETNYVATSYIENQGGGKFRISAFPTLAQVAPVFGIVSEDVDNDGLLDILMVGNDYANEPTNGQYDAFTGLFLKGDGKGKFNIVQSAQSGFYVGGDAKALVKIHHGNSLSFIASQNQDSLKVFSGKENTRVFTPESYDYAADITYHDGRKQRVEFYYGSGYLSQSTRKLSVPPGVKSMTVFSTTQKPREIEF